MTNENCHPEECHHHGNKNKQIFYSSKRSLYSNRRDRSATFDAEETLNVSISLSWLYFSVEDMLAGTHLEFLVEFAAVSVQHGQIQRPKVCIETRDNVNVNHPT